LIGVVTFSARRRRAAWAASSQGYAPAAPPAPPCLAQSPEAGAGAARQALLAQASGAGERHRPLVARTTSSGQAAGPARSQHRTGGAPTGGNWAGSPTKPGGWQRDGATLQGDLQQLAIHHPRPHRSATRPRVVEGTRAVCSVGLADFAAPGAHLQPQQGACRGGGMPGWPASPLRSMVMAQHADRLWGRGHHRQQRPKLCFNMARNRHRQKGLAGAGIAH